MKVVKRYNLQIHVILILLTAFMYVVGNITRIETILMLILFQLTYRKNG